MKALIAPTRSVSQQIPRRIPETHTPVYRRMPATVAAPCEAWTVFSHSNTGDVGSNLTRGMDVCLRLFCVFAVPCIGSGLATGWSPVQGVLPTVYRITKLKKRPGPNKGLYNRWMNEYTVILIGYSCLYPYMQPAAPSSASVTRGTMAVSAWCAPRNRLRGQPAVPVSDDDRQLVNIRW
jgi:hypothetical protein